MMKFAIGLVISFAVGVGCRLFDIPVGSPSVIPGALLVLAMTIGYSSTNRLLNRGGRLATTAHLCGGPTGTSAAAGSISNRPSEFTVELKERARCFTGTSDSND